MFCPLIRDECLGYDCGWWSDDYEECAIKLIGDSAQEISFAADDVNLDCGIRVHVTKEEVAADEN